MDAFPLLLLLSIVALGAIAAVAGQESRDGFDRSHH
jgi:nitrate reductase gamma subunit